MATRVDFHMATDKPTLELPLNIWRVRRPGAQAAVVVMSNAADEIAVPSTGLWGDVVKLLYPSSLPTWP